MELKKFAALSIILLVCAPQLHGQAEVTASRPLDLSVFAGLSRTDTQLDGVFNSDVTAGASLGFPRWFGLIPSAEVRGTSPVSDGQIVTEKSIMAGMQMTEPVGRVRPFVDVFLGRAQFSYLNGGISVPRSNVIYTKSASNLFSPGFGSFWEVGPHLLVRVDAQLQYSKTPVTASGHLISIPVTLGIVYHFPGTKHGRPYPGTF
jgi:hypothetical protein